MKLKIPQHPDERPLFRQPPSPTPTDAVPKQPFLTSENRWPTSSERAKSVKLIPVESRIQFTSGRKPFPLSPPAHLPRAG